MIYNTSFSYNYISQYELTKYQFLKEYIHLPLNQTNKNPAFN